MFRGKMFNKLFFLIFTLISCSLFCKEEKNYLTFAGGRNSFEAELFLIEYKPSFCLYKKLYPFIGLSGNMYKIFTIYSGVQADYFIKKRFFISPQISLGYASINVPFAKVAIYSGWQFDNYSRFGLQIGHAGYILNPIKERSLSAILFYSVPF